MQDLIGIALRISILYVYVLALLRLSGKRSLGNLSPLDFVVALVIGDLFDDVIWAEIPVAKGLVGVTTIIFLHTIMSYLTFRSQWLHTMVESTKTIVVKNSRFVEEGLALERTSKDTVYSQLRLQMEENLQEVRAASWEPSGQLSVQKKEAQKPVQKKDLPQLLDLYS